MMNPLPAGVPHLLQQARGELAARRYPDAAATLATVLAAAPDCVPALGLAATAAHFRGRHGDAVRLLRQAVHLEPDDAQLQSSLGVALAEAGEAAAALDAFRRACELAPGLADGWFNLGRALKSEVRLEAAAGALGRALQIDPAHAAARVTLADVRASRGDIAGATADLREALQRHPDDARAWMGLANLKVVKFSAGDTARLQALFGEAGRPDEERALFGFALAQALEDQGDYATSFAVLRRANRLVHRHAPWDAARQHAHVAAIERAFAHVLPHSPAAGAGRGVILVTGMPRSGTSLVEQILASHPQVEGANEITALPDVLHEESERRGRVFPEWVVDASAADWQRLGDAYLARTARWRADKPRFTDKNLGGWRRAGAALAMLPGVRVVIVRRDPVETCLACYRQWFSHGTAYTYDLGDLAAYCADFQRLGRFWREHHPGQVLDFEYEALLAEPEASIRRLLAFCGLSFDPACLAFEQTRRAVVSASSAAQVRQPLQRHTARAPRYGHLLDALRDRLRAEGVTVAAAPAA